MSIAKLSIDLEARLAGLQQGLDKAVSLAEKDGKRMEAAFLRARGALLGVGAALAGALGSAAVVSWVRNSIDAADAAAKQARTVGLLTEEVTALNYAAELSGVSQDELTAALVRLSRTAADADKGVKGATEAFDRLGVKVRDTDGRLKSSGELLNEISDRLAKLPAGIDKTALATDLFGRSGAKLISLLDGGSDGLRKMRDEAERLGLVIGSDTAAKAEQFNDNVTRLQKSMEGFSRQVAEAVIPTLTKLSERLVQNARDAGLARGAFITLFEYLFGSLDVLEATSEKVAKLEKQISDLQSLQSTIPDQGSAEALSVIRQIEAKSKELDAARRALKQLRGEVVSPAPAPVVTTLPPPPPPPPPPPRLPGTVVQRAEAFGPDLPAELADALRALEQTDTAKLEVLRTRLSELLNLQAAGIGGEKTAEAIAATREELERFDPLAESSAKRLRDLQQAGAQSFEATRTPLERLNIELARQQQILDALGPSYRDTYERAVFAAQDAFDAATMVNKELEKADTLAQDLGLTFSSAFEDAIVQGKGLRDVLQGLEQDILRIVTRKLVTEPLGNAITGILGGLFGGGSGGGLGGILSGLFGGFFADGGFLPPGRWGIAGERGPEPIFGGRTGLTVQPNGGGMRVVQNFNITGPVDRSTQAQIAAAAARGLQMAAVRNN